MTYPQQRDILEELLRLTKAGEVRWRRYFGLEGYLEAVGIGEVVLLVERRQVRVKGVEFSVSWWLKDTWNALIGEITRGELRPRDVILGELAKLASGAVK